MNTAKLLSTTFHLNNHEASKTFNIKVKNEILPSDPSPNYLGVTLDRQINYRKYLEGCANKIAKRNCILRKLSRTTRCASQSVLRTSTLALCKSAHEYCAPVWTRSQNTKLVDVKLRKSMRTIGGCLK
ncbi:RNA-directed DNA polymerase from mobile element jockey-like [Elysia marginata]|uniref:RNA-directed DNA polymerase from mobile element jockey-like n=1 Tax=Elysia marginata TaxID=1093978 RepID=A0AAV4I4I9_9GAST|nr:RNA-directed DNA polymerase from mobile element jockey-like [Elysia marginata]